MKRSIKNGKKQKELRDEINRKEIVVGGRKRKISGTTKLEEETKPISRGEFT